MERRVGLSESRILATQSNLANTYDIVGRLEEANRMMRDVYSGLLKLSGREDERTLIAALNYADSLLILKRFEEAKSLIRKTMPVGRRILGENNDLTLKMRWLYAKALYLDDGATLDDLREAVTTLEETERTARRVLGSAHPLTTGIEDSLGYLRAALRARETPGSFQGETPCSFQRASEEKLRSRRIVSVADRFRRSAAATRPTPGGDGSRSTSTDAPPSPPGNA